MVTSRFGSSVPRRGECLVLAVALPPRDSVLTHPGGGESQASVLRGKGSSWKEMSAMSWGPGPGPREQPVFLATEDNGEATGFLVVRVGAGEVSWTDHQESWIVTPAHR